MNAAAGRPRVARDEALDLCATDSLDQALGETPMERTHGSRVVHRGIDQRTAFEHEIDATASSDAARRKAVLACISLERIDRVARSHERGVGAALPASDRAGSIPLRSKREQQTREARVDVGSANGAVETSRSATLAARFHNSPHEPRLLESSEVLSHRIVVAAQFGGELRDRDWSIRCIDQIEDATAERKAQHARELWIGEVTHVNNASRG